MGVFVGGGVAGFVDSGAEMPMPSASDRSTPEWTPVDSSGLSPERRRPDRLKARLTRLMSHRWERATPVALMGSLKR